MGIEFFTGFEGTTTTEDCRAMFDGIGGGSAYRSGGGYPSGICFGPSGYLDDSDVYYIKNCIAAKTKAMGHHVYAANISTVSDEYLMYFIGPNVRIHNTSDGIYVVVNDVYLGTYGSQISTEWTHIEAELFSDAVVGYLKIKVNGTLICDVQDINTTGNDITSVRWGVSNRNTCKIDNIYIADELQGEIYSVLLTPDADASVEFDPLTGVDNFAMLQTNDGDTSYVQSDTLGSKDLYDYGDLPAGLVPKAVTTVTTARKSGTGERQLQGVVKQDSTEYDVGVPVTLSTVYPDETNHQPINRTYPLAPDGTEWTASKVNAIQFGFKVPV